MTQTPFRILALSGSLRRDSYNWRLIDHARELAPDGVDVEVIPLGRIPPYNADVEAQGLPAPVARLKDRIDEADALLVATPEYNAGIPGVLKNAIDWASRPAFQSPLVGKPVGLVGATPGRGGARNALTQLRAVLESTRAEPLGEELSISGVHEKLRGDMLDPAVQARLRALLERLANAPAIVAEAS
ncbi:MAG: NAD(P)H-dependent oxidoreductase [Chloroflexi bacterium]|nr:NAD(P)H-dependent oxidoreductase [Chloroflexota bacterium]